ncbi:AI-2E family transporter [Micrococcus sp. TA1]|uniref:AI-2E family transporter n=1 Tax=Micrococcus sp. TA1 TaxID=681627 RepID=UPI0016119A40|nr:putative PurR-regulated permease PerM [Micrococcus sp. TA1]
MTTPHAPQHPQDPLAGTGPHRAGPGATPDGDAEPATGSPAARPPGPWSDGMGRAGARAGQTLLIAAVVVGVLWLLLRVSVVLVAVLVAFILAAAVAPLVRWLVARGWSHLWATLAAFLGILVLVGGVVTGVVVAVRNEWDALTASAIAGWQQLQDWITSGPLPVDAGALQDVTGQVTDFLTGGEFARGLASNTLTGLSAATEFLTGVVLMVVVLFFLLKDGWKITSFTLRWFRDGTRAKLAESVDRSSQVLGGYVRGTATVALVDAVLIGLGLFIIGVPLALPLAVIVFIGAFVPIVGATVAGILAALVALVTTGPVEALIVVAIVVAVNQLEGNLLQPVVMGRTLSLHALIVLLALTVGTIVGGIFGAILAVPYTAVAWTLIQVWSDRYQTGPDPVLGQDPLDPKDRASAKATPAQRLRYQRMRRQRRRSVTPAAAGSHGPAQAPPEGDDVDAATADRGPQG